MEIVQVGVAIIRSTTFKILVYFSSYSRKNVKMYNSEIIFNFLHNHHRLYDDL